MGKSSKLRPFCDKVVSVEDTFCETFDGDGNVDAACNGDSGDEYDNVANDDKDDDNENDDDNDNVATGMIMIMIMLQQV